MKTKIQIKSIFGSIRFEYETENNTTAKTLEQAVKEGVNLIGANLEGADLEDANLEDANLRDVNLIGVNLRGAIKLPIYCSWSIGITDNQIHIGCEKGTIEEWDLFFASDKVLNTERNTPEFKQIKAAYEGYKAYYLALQLFNH